MMPRAAYAQHHEADLSEVPSRWGIRSLMSCARPNLFPLTKHASVSSCRAGGSTTIVPMLRSPDPPLYPDETEIARRVLGDRAREWPGKAAVLERDGLPKIDPLMGGRFWPAVHQFFLDRHGVTAQPSHGAPLPAKSRVRLVPFAPDGEPDFDGEKAQAARGQRRDRPIGRARPPRFRATRAR
jgi:hypothetical protein